ncbi:unnamed protein product, partial [Plutella xylostella]
RLTEIANSSTLVNSAGSLTAPSARLTRSFSSCRSAARYSCRKRWNVAASASPSTARYTAERRSAARGHSPLRCFSK